MSRGIPVGAPRRGYQRAHGSGQTGTNVQQKQYREPPIASAVGGTITKAVRSVGVQETRKLSYILRICTSHRTRQRQGTVSAMADRSYSTVPVAFVC
jgi:hypothetical protein